jgi:hypothetical protein
MVRNRPFGDTQGTELGAAKQPVGPVRRRASSVVDRNCTSGDNCGTLMLSEVFDECFSPQSVPM